MEESLLEFADILDYTIICATLELWVTPPNLSN